MAKQIRKKYVLTGLALLLSVVLNGSAVAASDHLNTLKELYDNAKLQSSRLNQDVINLNWEERLTYGQWLKVKAALESSYERERAARNRVVTLQLRIARDRIFLMRDNHQVMQARRQMREQVLSWYELGSVSYLQILLSARNFSDLLGRMSSAALLLGAQKSVYIADERLLNKVRVVEKSENEERKLAARALSSMQAISKHIKNMAKRQHLLYLRTALLRADATRAHIHALRTMQRLASQIAAVEEAKARAAALLAAKKAGQAAPPPEAGVLQTPLLQKDLTQAAGDAGVGATWVPWLMVLVGYESGGNKTAVSPILVDGEHASGLLQMLPDTFYRYAMPGHQDIWNPIDNAIAAIRYIENDYGNPWSIPGIQNSSTYHGY